MCLSAFVAILSGLSGLGIKTMQNNSLSEKIRHLADSIGIDAMGFAEASEFSDYALKNSKRRDPKLSLPNAKTIIIAGIYIGAVVNIRASRLM